MSEFEGSKRRMPDAIKQQLISISGDKGAKIYLPVAYRIAWMREEEPDWGIETELLVAETLTEGRAVYKAAVKDGSGRVIGTGHGTETQKGFPSGWFEKAETIAIGRALAVAGFGTQFDERLDVQGKTADAPLASRPPVGSALGPAISDARTAFRNACVERGLACETIRDINARIDEAVKADLLPDGAKEKAWKEFTAEEIAKLTEAVEVLHRAVPKGNAEAAEAPVDTKSSALESARKRWFAVWAEHGMPQADDYQRWLMGHLLTKVFRVMYPQEWTAEDEVVIESRSDIAEPSWFTICADNLPKYLKSAPFKDRGLRPGEEWPGARKEAA